ncbi:aminobenzoyl-glutamate utilization protein B [Lachnospiraceae bacterium PF1-21]|nr:amidohydrolase [Lachnospiraceae bacterium OttesenSCG-928-J05]
MNKKEVQGIVKSLDDLCQKSCRTIWNQPEIGGTEKEGANYFRQMLKEEGFVIVNEEKMEHAFYAEYGSGSPVIAILGEFDALPGLSQKVTDVKEPIEEGAPGHGCGHNLLGTSAALGAIAIKRFLEEDKLPGTVRFYGCPEEELLCGKVKMAHYQMFDGCDFAISWHPMNSNMVYDSGYLASASVHFEFKGISSHAAFAPEVGRSALDAVELMNVGVNYLREHVTSQARIHYTTDSGGFAPNIVPPRAGSWYYVRAPYISDVKDIIKRVKKAADGAALMTETTVEMKVDYGCCEMQENHAYADLTYENLKEAELSVYTAEEVAFAKKLNDQVIETNLQRMDKLLGTNGAPLPAGVEPRNLYEKIPLTGSSDSGDVSQIMPMCMFTTTCWPTGVAPHTWQATASAGSTIGEKGAMDAGKVIAGIAYDLYTKPEVREAIQKEFSEKKKSYEPMYQE